MCSIFCKSQMFLCSSGNGGGGVGHDARYAKGSAELTWLWYRRNLENIFLLQWFGFPCLSSEADVVYVSVWDFGLCQEQLGNWFQSTFWWAHLWRQISLQSITHSCSPSHLVPRTATRHFHKVAHLSCKYFGIGKTITGTTCFSCCENKSVRNKSSGPWYLGQQFG